MLAWGPRTARGSDTMPQYLVSQVTFRIPDNIASGSCIVAIKVHGQASNSGMIDDQNSLTLRLCCSATNLQSIQLQLRSERLRTVLALPEERCRALPDCGKGDSSGEQTRLHLWRFGLRGEYCRPCGKKDSAALRKMKLHGEKVALQI
jgi:hypothetical protein